MVPPNGPLFCARLELEEDDIENEQGEPITTSLLSSLNPNFSEYLQIISRFDNNTKLSLLNKVISKGIIIDMFEENILSNVSTSDDFNNLLSTTPFIDIIGIYINTGGYLPLARYACPMKYCGMSAISEEMLKGHKETHIQTDWEAAYTNNSIERYLKEQMGISIDQFRLNFEHDCHTCIECGKACKSTRELATHTHCFHDNSNPLNAFWCRVIELAQTNPNFTIHDFIGKSDRVAILKEGTAHIVVGRKAEKARRRVQEILRSNPDADIATIGEEMTPVVYMNTLPPQHGGIDVLLFQRYQNLNEFSYLKPVDTDCPINRLDENIERVFHQDFNDLIGGHGMPPIREGERYREGMENYFFAEGRARKDRDSYRNASESVQRLFDDVDTLDRFIIEASKRDHTASLEIIRILRDCEWEIITDRLNVYEASEDDLQQLLFNTKITELLAISMTTERPHSPEIPYICREQDCMMTFETEAELEFHIDLDHDVSREHVPQCYFIPEECLMLHTGIDIEYPRAGENHIRVCTDCDMVFCTIHELSEHCYEHHRSKGFDSLYFAILDKTAKKGETPTISDLFPEYQMLAIESESTVDALIGVNIDREVNERTEDEKDRTLFVGTQYPHCIIHQDGPLATALRERGITPGDTNIPDPCFLSEKPIQGYRTDDNESEDDIQDSIEPEHDMSRIENEDDDDDLTSEEFEAELISRLNNIETIQECEELREELLTISMPVDDIDDPTVIVHLIKKEGWLPSVGHSCLRAHCNHVKSDYKLLNKHNLSKQHTTPEFRTQPIQCLHGSISSPGRFVVIDSQGHIIDRIRNQGVDTEPISIPFDLNDRSVMYQKAFTDYMRKLRKDPVRHQRLNTFGPFWGSLILASYDTRTLHVSDIMEPIDGFLCDKANCCAAFCTVESVQNHQRQQHGLDTKGPFQKIQFKFVPYETERAHVRDRIADEQARNRDQEEQRIEAIAANLTARHGVNEEDARAAATVTVQNHPAAADMPSIEETGEETLPHRITEEENEALTRKAETETRRLLEKERRGTSIPQIQREIRPTVITGLANLYRHEIIPMCKKFFPHNDSPEEKTKLDYMVLYATDVLRHHCEKTMRIDCTKKKSKQTELVQLVEAHEDEGNSTDNEGDLNEGIAQNGEPNPPNQQREDPEDEGEGTSQDDDEESMDGEFMVSATAHALTKNMRIARSLLEVESRSSPQETAMTRALNTILDILRGTKDENFIRNTFGARNLNAVRAKLSAPLEEFEKMITWLDKRITLTTRSQATRRNKIRAHYMDNPSKCLKNDIFARERAECTIDPETFADIYGETWSLDPPEYTNIFFQEKYSTEKLTFEDDVLQELVNPKTIEGIIKRKNPSAAHGLDAISNVLFKACTHESKRFFTILMKAIIMAKHIPTNWKCTKTAMVPKKGDPDNPRNWRPVGITSTLQRVVSSIFNTVLQKTRLFCPEQKGFVPNECAGDHIAMLNELIHNAKRKNEELFLTAIDFKNAFGSVPHQLIFDAMNAKGFPPEVIDIFKDMYTDCTTMISVGGRSSGPINWKRGVIQGDPASPMLFNLALDPFLQYLNEHHRKDGYRIKTGDNEEQIFTAQAYADDVVLISGNADGMRSLLKALEEFAAAACIEVAPHKCITMKRRTNQEKLVPFKYKGIEIPIIDTGDTLSYLGAPISGKKVSKIQASQPIVTEIINELKLVFRSELTLSMKIDATRNHLIPKLDYLLRNGQFRLKDLEDIDEIIRGLIAHECKSTGIPKKFFYISVQKGGLGLPRLADRQDMLQIQKFGRLLTCKDEKVKKSMKSFTKAEFRYRGLDREDDSEFLTWNIKSLEEQRDLTDAPNNRTVNETKGTDCAAVQACLAAQATRVGFRMDNDDVFLKDLNQQASIFEKCETPRKISEKLIRFQKTKEFEQLTTKDPTHSHSLMPPTCEESHQFMQNTHYANSFLVRTAIAIRTNTFPTPANLAFHRRNPEMDICPICHKRGATLHHLLNGCTPMSRLYTYRHDLIVSEIRKRVVERFTECVVCTDRRIQRPPNVPEDAEDLCEATRYSRPDIVIVRPEEKEMQFFEVTVPYGQMCPDQNNDSLTIRDRGKTEKYAALRKEIEDKWGYTCIQTNIVVSSQGFVFTKTRDGLRRIFKESMVRKIIGTIAHLAIVGSSVAITGAEPRMFGINEPIEQDVLDRAYRNGNPRIVLPQRDSGNNPTGENIANTATPSNASDTNSTSISNTRIAPDTRTVPNTRSSPNSDTKTNEEATPSTTAPSTSTTPNTRASHRAENAQNKSVPSNTNTAAHSRRTNTVFPSCWRPPTKKAAPIERQVATLASKVSSSSNKGGQALGSRKTN